MGSVCGLVDRAVASDARDPRFESSHWKILITLRYIEKTKIKEKRGQEWPSFKKNKEGYGQKKKDPPEGSLTCVNLLCRKLAKAVM